MKLQRKITKLGTIVLFAFLTFTAFAEKAPIKFGKPTIEELEMTVYDADSSAEAVILCSYGYFDNTTFQFVSTYRIKILKQSGTSWGTRTFKTIGDNVSVRGITFNREGGQTVETKLKNESILKKKYIDPIYSVSVEMPNVKVGSVVDIELASSGLIREWYFQDRIPVKYSELEIQPTTYVTFQKNFFGYLPYDFSSPTRWVISNVPAFKIEPYMDSYENYVNKVEIDLQSISYPGYFKDFASNWEQVGKLLLDDDNFGGVLRSSAAFLNDVVDEINASCKTQDEKLKAAYEKAQTIKWNEEKNVIATANTLGQAFKNKLGNSSDINFILMKLLEKLDFQVYPVVLSSRSNGQLSFIFPSISKLDYTICAVRVNDELMLLDATDDKLPLGLLPERVINVHGRIIYSREKTDWIDLTTKKLETEKEYIQAELNTDYTITGKRTVAYSDYSAAEKREELENYNSTKDYTINEESQLTGLKIQKIDQEGRDNLYAKMQESWDFSLDNKVDVIDDMVMLNVNLWSKIDENPFKMEERKYPVNYPYGSHKSTTVVLKIPAGFELSEIPEPAAFSIPNGGGVFKINYVKQNGMLLMNSDLSMGRTLFLPDEYPILKEFFALIVKKQSEPVIIKQVQVNQEISN